jgi:hypothetical protein
VFWYSGQVPSCHSKSDSVETLSAKSKPLSPVNSFAFLIASFSLILDNAPMQQF